MQGTATLGDDTTLQKPRSVPCTAQSVPRAPKTSNCSTQVHPAIAQEVSGRPKALKITRSNAGRSISAPNPQKNAFLLSMEAIWEPDHVQQEPASPQQPTECQNPEAQVQQGEESGERPELLKRGPTRRQGQDIILAMDQRLPGRTLGECSDTDHLERNQYAVADNVLMRYEVLQWQI